MKQDAGLTGTNGTRIALKSVHIDGRLDGPLAVMAITQRYHNDSGKKLEIVHTFPLPWGATLLGLEATLGDRQLRAVVMKREEASAHYEKALDDGDTPVLVELAASGLYAANLGNIENGEDVTVEIRYAQLLRFGGGSLTLRIPCAIAPRHGDPHKDTGLAPHETGMADMFTEYPLTLRIILPEHMAACEVRSFTHAIRTEAVANGMAVRLDNSAALDRDFVLNIMDQEECSFALLAPDDGKHMMLAGFRPKFPKKHEPLRLKILVDCSSSMAGDSIASARRALFGVLGLLERGDYVSYSRFGETVWHESDRLLEHKVETMVRLSSAINDMRADMGGTKMEAALLSTFSDIAMPEGDASSPCVLLITDGAVWDVERIVSASRSSGHRLFTVGLGSAPAESLLRELAAKTGGACELVPPNENASIAIGRMGERMRGARAAARVDWGCEPLWQSALPLSLYADDTVHAFASFEEAPGRPPVLHWVIDGVEGQAGPETIHRTDEAAIARLAGAARMAEAATPEEAEALALKHQLIGARSALFLAHAREEATSAEPPALHQVPQMMAAGHSGFGTVKSGASDEYRWLQTLTEPARHIPADEKAEGPDDDGVLLSIRVLTLDDSPTPLALLQLFEDALERSQDVAFVMRRLSKKTRHSTLKAIVRLVSEEEHLSYATGWAILLDWLGERCKNDFTLSHHATSLLRTQLDSTPVERTARAREFLMAILAKFGPGAWNL